MISTVQSMDRSEAFIIFMHHESNAFETLERQLLFKYMSSLHFQFFYHIIFLRIN